MVLEEEREEEKEGCSAAVKRSERRLRSMLRRETVATALRHSEAVTDIGWASSQRGIFHLTGELCFSKWLADWNYAPPELRISLRHF